MKKRRKTGSRWVILCRFRHQMTEKKFFIRTAVRYLGTWDSSAIKTSRNARNLKKGIRLDVFRWFESTNSAGVKESKERTEEVTYRKRWRRWPEHCDESEPAASAPCQRSGCCDLFSAGVNEWAVSVRYKVPQSGLVSLYDRYPHSHWCRRGR